MDSLPLELVSHILTFLDGDNVLRFKELSLRFAQIISKNRTSLRLPPVDLHIRHIATNDQPKRLDFHFRSRFCFFIDYWNPNAVKINQFEVEDFIGQCNRIDYSGKCNPSLELTRTRCECFFRPFFKRHSSEQSLRELFIFIFQKVEIARLLMDPFDEIGWISHFIDAIQISSPIIRETAIDIYRYEEHFRILEAIGKWGKKGKDYPTIVFGVEPKEFNYFWHQITPLNEIASDFPSCWFYLTDKIDSNTLSEVIIAVVTAWFSEPISKFHFGLSIIANDDEPQLFRHWKFNDRFEFELKNTDRFQSTDRETSSFKVAQRITGNSLTFNKKNGKMRLFNNTIVPCILVTIDACLH